MGDLPARCYVPSAGALRRALRLVDRERRHPVLGPAVAGGAGCPENTEHPPDAAHPWRVAHPIVCALRLGRDPARGKEIVDAWGIVPGGGG